MRGSSRKLRGQMHQSRRGDEREQVHVVLQPARDHMFDPRAQRDAAVVGHAFKNMRLAAQGDGQMEQVEVA